VTKVAVACLILIKAAFIARAEIIYFNELEIVKRELKNSANLIVKKQQRLGGQQTAFLVLFIVLWLVIYFYYGRGFLR
jgi:hypothetical protein